VKTLKSLFLPILFVTAGLSCTAHASLPMLQVNPGPIGASCQSTDQVILSSRAGVLQCGVLTTSSADCRLEVDQSNSGSSYGYRTECRPENNEVAQRASAGVVQCFTLQAKGSCRVEMRTLRQWKQACDASKNEVVIAESADRVMCASVILR
jgi:hypothetical protein